MRGGWRVALHWAFFYTARNVTLAGACAAGAPGRAPGRAGPGGGKPRTNSQRTRLLPALARVGCMGRRSPGRKRTWRTSAAGYRRTRTLKNWLTWHRASGRGTHSSNRRRTSLRRGRDWTWRRRFIHRARPRSAERSCAAQAAAPVPQRRGGIAGRGAAIGPCGAPDAAIEGPAGAGGATQSRKVAGPRDAAVLLEARGGATTAAGLSVGGVTTGRPNRRAQAQSAPPLLESEALPASAAISGAPSPAWQPRQAAWGRAGGATASLCWVIAFNTSPGREMFDRSILVLISSSPRRRAERDFDDGACAFGRSRGGGPRTFSASCSSRELECVFFSVTPTRTRRVENGFCF